MSTTHKITYKCDVCGKESRNYREIRSEEVPCITKWGTLGSEEIDMCETCRRKLREVIHKYFADIQHPLWWDTKVVKAYSDEE